MDSSRSRPLTTGVTAFDIEDSTEHGQVDSKRATTIRRRYWCLLFTSVCLFFLFIIWFMLLAGCSIYGYKYYQLSDMLDGKATWWPVRIPQVWARCYKKMFPKSLGACYAVNAEYAGAEAGRLLKFKNNSKVFSDCVLGYHLRLFGYDGGRGKDAHTFSTDEKAQIEQARKEIVTRPDGNKAIVHIRTGDVLNMFDGWYDYKRGHRPNLSADDFLERWVPEEWGDTVMCYVAPRSEYEDVMRWPASLSEVVIISNPNHGSDGKSNQKSLDYLSKVRAIIENKCRQVANASCKATLRIANSEVFPNSPTSDQLQQMAAEADEDMLYFVLEGRASYLFVGGGGFGKRIADLARSLKSVKVQYGGPGFKRRASPPAKWDDGVPCPRRPGWPEKGWDP